MKSTILIVDDNKSVLTALQMLIQTEFETVITLSNPNQIQSIISKNSVDVVLLDMNFKAGIKAVEAVDAQLGRILDNTTFSISFAEGSSNKQTSVFIWDQPILFS